MEKGVVVGSVCRVWVPFGKKRVEVLERGVGRVTSMWVTQLMGLFLTPRNHIGPIFVKS